ncbi:hypothetical protein SGRIM128S_00667 [Streptomyces griseomycini]
MDGEHGEALVVSLGTYDHHPHYDLPDADRHAEEFRLLARRLGFAADVPPVTGTKDEVVQSLRGFAKSPARRRLVYWIGHGVQTGRDQTVLPCRDYSPDGLDGHLRPGELADLVRRMSGDVLLVIDACHAAFTAQDVYTDVFRSEDNHFGPRPLAKGWRMPGHEIRALDDAAPGAEPGSGWALGLLLPLALSFGAGLPEDDKTWLTAARALAAARGDVRVYGETDVIWIRRVAGAHIVAHGEGGQPVFRLNHEALAHHVLRSSGLTDQVAHEAMTQVLRTIHEQLYRGRVTTNPYIARYAAAHASRAGLLPELLDDGDLLVRLDPERFVAQLEQSAATSARAQLYRSVADDLVRRTPEERAALLQAAALRQHPELRAWARSAARLHWEDLWTTAEWSAPERSIALPFGDVLTVSAGPDGSSFAGERLRRWTGTHGRPDLVRGYLPADAHGNPVRLRALPLPRVCARWRRWRPMRSGFWRGRGATQDGCTCSAGGLPSAPSPSARRTTRRSSRPAPGRTRPCGAGGTAAPGTSGSGRAGWDACAPWP